MTSASAMAIKRGSIRQIQRYHHNYCLLCITGCFGCKWYRYKQSKKPSTQFVTPVSVITFLLLGVSYRYLKLHRWESPKEKKRKAKLSQQTDNPWDVLWFAILVLSFCFLGFFVSFMLVMANDIDNFNWFIYHQFKRWIDWHHVILSTSAAVFAYISFVMVLALFHIGTGYQLYLHYVHRVLLILADVMCISLLITLRNVALHEWVLQRLALLFYGPFLHASSVIVMTLLTWMIAGKLLHYENKGLKLFWLCVFGTVMIFLYVSPAIQTPPCVCQSHDLPQKPKIIAHRGGAASAPENTMAAFRRAADAGIVALESDVRISLDGIPMVFHDEVLHRTTNVAEIFPENASESISSFTRSDLEKLNVGEWFFKKDPFYTANSLSKEDQELYRKQKIPTFRELLDFAKNRSIPIFFDLMLPKDGAHPYYHQITDITIDVIKKSGIHPKLVWWSIERTNAVIPKDFKIFAKANLTKEFILQHRITNINARFDHLSEQDIKFFKDRNMSINMYMVDAEWLYSLYWCLGVNSVATNWIHKFSKLEAPLWHMTPQTYMVLWITIDCVSLVVILCIFAIQSFRGSSVKKRFTPSTAIIHYRKPRNGQMKDKLLYTVDSSEALDAPEGGVAHGVGLQAIEDETQTSNDGCPMQTLDVSALSDPQDHRTLSPSEINVEFSR